MKNAVFNPENKNTEDLPVIYGFNNGGNPGWLQGLLMAEDGTYLGSHVCSNEHYMLGDLGILQGSRSDRHEHFQKHYPNGYKMEFVSYDDFENHQGLQNAIKNADEKSSTGIASTED